MIVTRNADLSAAIAHALGGEARCRSADQSEQAIRAIGGDQPDLWLLDADGGENAFRATELIRLLYPGAAIVVLTGELSEKDFLRAVHAGASGYLLKNIGSRQLAHVISRVLHGEAAVPRSLTRSLVAEVAALTAPPRLSDRRPLVLSPRETQVLRLLCERRSTGEIAARLEIADVTVRRHRASLLAKLDATRRLAATEGPPGRTTFS